MNEEIRKLVEAAREGVEGHAPTESEALAYRLANAVEDLLEAQSVSADAGSAATVIEMIDALPGLVREKRERDGLSLRAAGIELGVAANTIRRMEDGHGVNAEVLKILMAWVVSS
jgi:hypothetical protein